MQRVWSDHEWRRFEADATIAARKSGWNGIARAARLVLKTYSTSFFLVTRFLPPAKRADVEVVYAAVRYPDEIVDTFPLEPEERHQRLDEWVVNYELAVACSGFAGSLDSGCSPFVAAFAEVVRRRGIPHEHYRAFLNAMRADVEPRRYDTLDDLIENYIHGSAIVVGYFLAYIYGPSGPALFPRALKSARHLGIALQLTNFLRDVGEDQGRGRLYIPLDFLADEGIDGDAMVLRRVIRRMSDVAEQHYGWAEQDLGAFAEDSRVAIRACIDVYRRLNQRIGGSADGVQHRETVPMAEKFSVLPSSKYWRLPLAWVGVI